MINPKELEPNQCYLEYPDGSIRLVFLKEPAKEFTVIGKGKQPDRKELVEPVNSSPNLMYLTSSWISYSIN